MKLFLTSHLGEHYWEESGPIPQLIPEENNWREVLRAEIGDKNNGLLIAALPNEFDMNDSMAKDMMTSFKMTGYSVEEMKVCDNRNWEMLPQLINEADFIVLSGGHVPTQNDFFVKIGLKELIHKFDGVIIGISAGTMNCADEVYACPEEAGESIDPNYKRYIQGLGLTTINVLPHYQYLKDVMLDGVKMVDDIALKDSYRKSFIALVDNSYIKVENGNATICGEAYKAYDGKIEQICTVNNILELDGEKI